MPMTKDTTLDQVRSIYGGAEGALWELLMGQQIHLGGLKSSLELAERARLADGLEGVDLCCCNGAGMRFLVRFCGARSMTGVDATPEVIKLGEARCREEGLGASIRFVHADVCACPLPTGAADFVWGEDAWCYVWDKPQLVAEAARLLKPGGVIAFTDWISGPVAMTDAELERFLGFMRFPNVGSLERYSQWLRDAGFELEEAEDTGRFARCVDLYLAMVDQQLAYDALRILSFDRAALDVIAAEMQFMQGLAHAGKVIQGRFIARKT